MSYHSVCPCLSVILLSDCICVCLSVCLFFFLGGDNDLCMQVKVVKTKLYVLYYAHNILWVNLKIPLCNTVILSIHLDNQCNETQARRCYNEFDVNATFICPEVRRLKLCVSKLSGCHIMRHPSFAMSHKVLEDHSKCFVNYSIILEALKSRKSTEKRQETTQSEYKFAWNTNHTCRRSSTLCN